jgi:predicted ATPase
MFQIGRIEVEGFWETHHLKVDLFRDVTFFIGPNGTGKTTFINLIAAALTADFATLEKIPFKRITISLVPVDGPQRPVITVSKTPKKERPLPGLEYKIRADKGDNATEQKFSFDEVQEYLYRNTDLASRHVREMYRRSSRGIEAALKELVQVQWLSVHRAEIPSTRDERTYESAVDRKLEALSNELVRYFATFIKQKDEKVRQFQEYIFFSLLEQPEPGVLFGGVGNEEDARNQEMTIAEIFRELHVNNPGTDDLIASFFKRASEAQNNVKKANTLQMEDFTVLLALRKINGVTKKWQVLQTQLSEIFAQRDRYIEIVNELLQRKKVEINDSNELVFTTRTGKPLTPQVLSSGEKQLLILLSEVLLQKQTPAVFIADEPELSLHVTWQEKLVSSLRRLNAHAQIIAATHSPDIVGPLSDRAIDMESVIP